MALYLTLFRDISGVCLFISFALILSKNRKAINWKLIVVAFILQNLIFLAFNYIVLINDVINYISALLMDLLSFVRVGTLFIFGDLANSREFGFVFLLVVAPSLIFLNCLVAILYYYKLIPKFIHFLASSLSMVIKLSGVESLTLIANIFLGMVESPLVIKNYLNYITESELGFILTTGLSNICATTLSIYTILLSNGTPAENILFTNYLLTAVFMNAISAVIFAKIIFPEEISSHLPLQAVKLSYSNSTNNLIDTIYQGAMSGLNVAKTVITILIATISLVHLIDGFLNWSGNITGLNNSIDQFTKGVFSSLSLEFILGEIFRVFAFFIGINWVDSLNVGSLLGQKVVLNEFIAFTSLGHMKSLKLLSQDSIFISTFGLASFSNLTSTSISYSIFTILSPYRKAMIGSLIWRALIGATLAGFLTANIAGFWHLYLT